MGRALRAAWPRVLLAALVAALVLAGASAHQLPDVAADAAAAAPAQPQPALPPDSSAGGGMKQQQMQPAAAAPAAAGAPRHTLHAAGAAFMLAIAAGCCAPLGACCVAFLNAERHSQLLPGSLALAAGVMIFVSIYEVLHESRDHFATKLQSTALIQLCTLGSFFAGVPICSILDFIADRALSRILKPKATDKSREGSIDLEVAIESEASGGSAGAAAVIAAGPPDPRKRAAAAGQRKGASLDLVREMSGVAAAAGACGERARCVSPPSSASGASDERGCDLLRTSILVTLALAIHNMPEGLATFVGYISAPHTGILVSIAIAMHNIPEGICIGVPVYFATGSKWKGVAWAAASGLTEPLGALIGFALQQTGHMDDVAMGVILGMVAGIMTSVSFSELLPRALAYDRAEGRWTYAGVLAGIGIMAVSLVLLGLLQG